MATDRADKLTLDTAPELNAIEMRLLARMPLHAITAVHGETGLRARLCLELARFPAADRARLEDALKLASRLHEHDRRQREPYLNHLLRVAVRIIHHYRVTDPDLICAALLHDSVEDHAEGLAPGGRQAAIVALAKRFGERTAAMVGAVTNPVYEPGRDEHEQYREHVIASLEASPWARVIKASDFTDNAVGVFHTTGPKLPKLIRKYRPMVPALRELILRPDTPLEPDVKEMIAGKLDTAEGRFAAICG
jgi:hypothetical protein